MKTTCPYCGVGCGVEVKALYVPVSGDRQHPANFGRLCVKGSALGETLTHDGRLLWPQIDGQRVSIDAALDHVAAGFRRIIDQHGPQAVAFYGSGQLLTEDYYTANKLMKGFIGAANIDTNSRLCMASAVVGYKRAFGADAVPCCYDDLEQADVVVLVGSNAAWAHPVAWQRLVQAKAERSEMQLVVIDPRRTASGDLADLHLALQPGSDSALFAGLLNWLARNAGIDTSMLPHLANVEATLAACEAWDVAAVAAACQLSEHEIVGFWQLFAAQPRVLTLWCMGINQSQTGSDNNNAILNAHLLSGKIGRAGCGPFSLTGQPNAMGGREVGGLANQLAAHMGFSAAEVDRVARFWGSDRVAQQPGLTAVNLFNAIERGDVKAVWIMGTNPAVSMPEGNRVAQALANCELVVVSEVSAHSDTAQFADVLLPAQAWGEKNGTVTNSERRISRQRSFTAPAGEAKADWWLLAQVAQRLGFGAAFAWQHPCEIFAEHAALSGFENHGTRAFDISALATITREQYDQLAPVQWPITAASPNGTARLFADRRFYHADGKARLLPPAMPIKTLTTNDYPLLMNTGRIRDQWHTMTRTGNVSRLMQHYDEPFVALNPLDAAAHGLSHGDVTRVQSVLGWYSGRVTLDSGLQRGQLFVPMHWTRQFSGQANVDGLVAATCCPDSAQPALKQTVVRLQPLRPTWQGWLWLPDIITPPALLYWSRAPQPGVQRYVLAGNAHAGEWLMQLPGMSALQWQQAQAGQQLHWLGWREDKLACAFYAAPWLPEIDHPFIAQAFSQPPDSPQQRHALLGGRPTQGGSHGRTLCSCFGVGEVAIRRAIAEGCDSPAALGAVLKCGTNCGSCIPELKQLLISARGAVTENIMTQASESLDKLFNPRDGEQAQGGVWLVGAGPGDVELLTLKAWRLINSADVVVYDRLVSEAIMAEVPPETLAIDVGKKPGSHGLKQAQINQLLVDLARSGRQVVRLKGGDPFIFGRGGEEMLYLQQAGITCQIVPGITAAAGCAAASGIPLTHRDCAQSLRFITGHGKSGEPQLDDASLAADNQTLVFYMGLKWSASISAQLQAQGRSAQTPVAIIENGTRADQRVMITTLAELAHTVEVQQAQSPALLLIGDVVRFYRHPVSINAHSSKVAAPFMA